MRNPPSEATQPSVDVRPFLTAAWRNLVMLNYEVDPGVLRPLVPRGVELDFWQDRCLISLVGFEFVDLCVGGLRLPLHRRFEEVNLRFYVARDAGGKRRRGVVFIKEVVPRRALAVATGARFFYNERYVACPMRSRISFTRFGAQAKGELQYAWRGLRGWMTIGARISGIPAPLLPETEAQFIAEHYWGYGRRRDGATLEYHVAHPSWSIWDAEAATVDGAFADFYGPPFGAAIARGPTSAFVADGSAVAVYRGVVVA